MRSLLFGFMASAILVAACSVPDDGGQPGAVGTSGSADYRVSEMSDDEAITSEVGANLLAHPELEQDIASGQLEVDADGGAVTLSGRVGTESEKAKAISVAWSVAGVTDVEDRVSVERQ